MLSAGRNVKSATDALQKVTEQYVYDAIRNPKPELASLLGQLRVVRRLNPSQYRVLKAGLPYIVCAMFSPPYRKTENFAYTEHFIIDIDHLSDKGMPLDEVRRTICADPRTLLCFASPSGDGLKVMMRLKERCYDAGLYKTFYQVFLHRYSEQYGLQQVVDSKTCDVARACFMSMDADAYFNAEAEAVELTQYLNPEADAQLAFDSKHEMDKEAKHGDTQSRADDNRPKDPTADIMAQIKLTLDPRLAQKPQRPPVYVPEILNDMMDALRDYVVAKGVDLAEVISIQYGKKLRFKVGMKHAEINIFHGKRGFSVVQSPRTGTDAEANELMATVIEAFLAEHY